MNYLNKLPLLLFAVIALWMSGSVQAEAATLQVSPSTGVYQAGSTFTAQVRVVTNGSPINAAEGTLTFNPSELSVVAVNRGSSIFNLWVTEPAFSNTAGTITFSGGVPSGYSGAAGNVLSVTFRAVNAGQARVAFSNGSVLANDGRGTNVLTEMNGGVFTIQAPSSSPEPERIVEYVPAANTPAAPVVTSVTHPNPNEWHTSSSAELGWRLPSDVTTVRTLLNESSRSIPTKVYENPIDSIVLDELPEGESYFHIQFRNNDGWGDVTSYRLAVDSEAPTELTLALSNDSDLSSPVQTLRLDAVDATSEVSRYTVKIDADEPYEYIDEPMDGLHTLAALQPGYHSVIVEAFDQAGNSIISTVSFTIEAFEQPAFTEIPSEMTTNVIPVIRGLTRPLANVEIFFTRSGYEPNVYQTVADESGEFTFIPDGTLFTGVYEVSAIATDQFGAQSEVSTVKRIAVQEPGYVRLGSQLVDAMSIIVPLLLMTLFLLLGIWYVFFLLRRFKGAVRQESSEALEILRREFTNLQSVVRSQETLLKKSRKTNKLTKAESDTIETFDRALQTSQKAVEKEITDVTVLTNNE